MDFQRSGFCALPDELIEGVLRNMAARDIISCSKTCKRVHRVVVNSSQLQLILELAVEGLRLRRYLPACTPYGTGTNTAAELLLRFRRWKDAWKLQTNPTRKRLEYSSMTVVVKDGFFATLFHSQQLNGHRPPFHGHTNGVKISRLWANKDEENLTVWREHPDLGISVFVFSFDPAENLLVLAEEVPYNHNDSEEVVQVHIRTFNSGLAHPNARHAVLGGVHYPDLSDCDIKSCGDLVSVLFITTSLRYLRIWNWKTGEEICKLAGAPAIAFLSPTSFVALRSDTLRLSGAVNKWGFQQLLQLFDISIGIERAVTLELGPEFRRSPEFDLVSQSTSTDTLNIPGDVPISPFIQDETAERAIVLHDWTGRGYSFVLVRPLLHILEERIRSPSLRIDYLSWSEWSPGTVYTIYANGVHVGPSSVCGSRIGIYCPREYLSQESNKLEKDAESLSCSDSDGIDNRSDVQAGEEAYPVDEVEGARAIAVLDFNPRPVLRALSRHVTPEDDDHANSQRAYKTFVNRTSFTGGIPVARLRSFPGGSEGGDSHEVAMHEDHMIITKDGYYHELLQFGQSDAE